MAKSRFLRFSYFLIGLIAIAIIGLCIYFHFATQVDLPIPDSTTSQDWKRKQISDSMFTIGPNWIRKSKSGLYEMYVEGEAFDRGVVIGKLSKELIYSQEKAFTTQIKALVPSATYRKFLTYFISWFNRDLNQSIPREFQLEIYGISLSASPEFDFVAPPYQRLINYHAAHDIGHALQNMSLIGCTSFAQWGNKGDSSLLIGRNFDFFVGEKFAKQKIIAFYKPTAGYEFVMVTFGGMTGVLSGMNNQGLTVTINAAKSSIPTNSSTPVSILSREILQYASTIDEAFTIAKKRKIFVSESFMIGSAKDGYVAIIEKTSEITALRKVKTNSIVSTNHFESDDLNNTELNLKHMQTSPSVSRAERVAELIDSVGQLNPKLTAEILRNLNGKKGTAIGLGNELAINQLISHHSIIFEPYKLKFWISTQPWQIGKYVCYDLNKIFSQALIKDTEIFQQGESIDDDPFLKTRDYQNYLKFFPYRFPYLNHNQIASDSLVKWNPNLYLSYLIAGDQEIKTENYCKASEFYKVGLTKIIASQQERDYMKSQFEKCQTQCK